MIESLRSDGSRNCQTEAGPQEKWPKALKTYYYSNFLFRVCNLKNTILLRYYYIRYIKQDNIRGSLADRLRNCGLSFHQTFF
jgi:hypothetical protein